MKSSNLQNKNDFCPLISRLLYQLDTKEKAFGKEWKTNPKNVLKPYLLSELKWWRFAALQTPFFTVSLAPLKYLPLFFSKEKSEYSSYSVFPCSAATYFPFHTSSHHFSCAPTTYLPNFPSLQWCFRPTGLPTRCSILVKIITSHPGSSLLSRFTGPRP